MSIRPSVLALGLVAISIFCLRAFAEPAPSPEGPLMVDVASATFTPGTITKDGKKVPAGTVEKVDGKFGKAVRFSFFDGASGGFHIVNLHPTPQWDAAEGFSFWVKGDGSQTFGGIELVDRDDYSLRFGYCFPIDSTEWKKITVRWRDVLPELAAPMMGGKDGYQPSHLGSLFFGKWFYWRDYPANSFTIDHIALEERIPAEKEPPPHPGLERVREKLKNHRPIQIVTMGDSLTDQHHWANKEIVWHGLLAKSIKEEFGSDVKAINPAIGGTTLSQNMILMPRWLKDAPHPDLVTIWFGGNDWDSKVRGPRYGEYLRACVDRIREMTDGSADVLIMTNIPGHETWETRKELEAIAKEVAAEKKTGVADVAAAFRATESADEAMKREYWAWDKVHLGKKGHEVTSEVVLKALKGK